MSSSSTGCKLKKKIKRALRIPPPPGTRVGIWEPHKLLYVRVPKCGNTSIMNAIDGVERTRLSKRKISAMSANWSTFSFVRNPWARMVSVYKHKATLESTSPRMENGVYQGFVDARIPVRPNMSFEDFCAVICDTQDGKTDKHVCSQTSFLIHKGEPIVSFIGKVENLESDWEKVMVQANLGFTLPHMNKTQKQHEHYSQFYTNSQLVNMVGDRYADDAKFFGYEFERS